MKQKDILLWTIAVLALLLSVLATFGSRLQGLSSQASSKTQNQGVHRSTTGGIVTDRDETTFTSPGGH